MAETPLYQSFTLESPWIGTFHYFLDGLAYHREALDDAAKIVQACEIKAVDRSTYDIAFREACRQAGKSR